MSKTAYLIQALVAIAAIAFAAIWLFNLATGSKPYFKPWGQNREAVRAACQQHVGKADEKAREAVERRAQEFAVYLESRKPGAKPFARDVVSPYGKWRVIKARLPFTDGNGDKKYIEETFDKNIFSSGDLAAQVRISVEGCAKDLEAIENGLAIALRQEILGRSLAPDEIPIAAEKFNEAMANLVAASKWDATKTVGNFVVSEVAAQVGTQVFVRLGVSAGILGAGAANSWWTLGAGLVIGFAVDMIWEWIDDPAGDIERKTIEALDALSAEARTAIREEMLAIVENRKLLWDETVKEMVR